MWVNDGYFCTYLLMLICTCCFAAPLLQIFSLVPTEVSDRHARSAESTRRRERKHKTHPSYTQACMHMHINTKKTTSRSETLSHTLSIKPFLRHYGGPVVSTLWFGFEATLQVSSVLATVWWVYFLLLNPSDMRSSVDFTSLCLCFAEG